ncbi:3-hydroxyacyl-thioester dehydratase X isoform X1 [Anguilla rostrata]|uniref:3-hydroxyacyl-thioester dehydratase X isoform X1 n=1 Tax=Anguilla rostrata TaxID=7938 RepID=UPI0030CD037C
MENYLTLFFIGAWTALCVYLFYTYLYRSYKLNKSGVVVFDRQREIPSFAYLLYRFTKAALHRRQGKLYPIKDSAEKVTFTIFNCRFQSKHLRRYCSAFGYGWDYPDSTYRDIPMCYPEVLSFRLLTMVVCAERFRLSPLGLVRVGQTLRTFQPVDELKKGPFSLQAGVVEYRAVERGVEVDIKLSAADRADLPVWEANVTLLSRDTQHITSRQPPAQGLLDPESEEVKAVEISVPWSTGLRCAWASGDYSPQHLLPVTARLLGCRRPLAPSLWVLSKCLAEVEKHKGADAVRAPVCMRVWFSQPLFLPGKAAVRLWETAPGAPGATGPSHRHCAFQMEDSLGTPCIVGEIGRLEQ